MIRLALPLVLLATHLVAQPIDTVQQINTLFSNWNNATPGGSVLVARGNQIIYHKAFGLADLEHNTPNTTETIFESGSVAKQFTAAAILLLAKEGKLSLQDDVRKYVPELPIYQKPITILHLFNHTSGLKDWGSVGSLTGWPRTTRVYTNALALQIICRQKSTNFVPGAEYSYSNSNYTMLVTIVERISKMTLAEFTQKNFFQPLGMTNTQWRDNFREVIPNRAIAYSKENSVYVQNMPFENVHGHGGLLLTTADLLRWNQLLETHAILGDQAAQWRITKGVLNNGQEISYAAGVNVNNRNGFREISHSGATAGYRAWLAYYPQKKLTVALLSNDASFNPSGKGVSVAEIFLGREPAKKSAPREALTLTAADQSRWVGTFRSIRGFDVFSIEGKEGQLHSNQTPLKLTHRDTLLEGSSKWTWSGKNLLLMNNNDTSRYVRMANSDLTEKILSSLKGAYHSDEADMTFVVDVTNQQVRLLREPHPPIELKPVFKDAFRDEDGSLYEFKRDKAGKVSSLEISQSRAYRVPFIRAKP